MKIPYGKQEILDADINTVIDTLQSDYLTQGPKIQEFEKLVAQYHNATYGVAFCNGTAALHACYYATQVQSGDEVISSPITFVASLNGALYQGATPVFADIDSTTNCIDISQVSKKITNKTKAVCPVSFAGYPCDLKKLRETVGSKINIIHDAAHAIGSKRDGSFGCEYADLTILSFHPVKHITTGEGGMVLTNNRALYERLLSFRTHGITKDKDSFQYENDGPWYYEMQDLGYNYRITDFQCALGIEQFKRMDDNLLRRNQIARRYNEAFSSCEWIKTPPSLDLGWIGDKPIAAVDNLHSYHLYTIQVDPAIRKDLFCYLHKHNIFVQIHYVPVHTHPYYRKNYTEGLSCQVAESIMPVQ